jgi:F-type H+-transporting ATPase subunit gamma
MPSLKELRTRINSVQSTKKITSAMKVVASSKLRLFEVKLKNLRKYSQEMQKLTSLALSNQFDCNLKDNIFINPDLTKPNLIIGVTSNRGLCGNFNNLIVKKVQQTISDLQQQNKSFFIKIFGQKGKIQLKEEIENFHIQIDLPEYKHFEMHHAINIADQIYDLLVTHQISKVLVVKNNFFSIFKQSIELETLLPVDLSKNTKIDIGHKVAEPTIPKALNRILKQNLATQIYMLFLESSVCEEAIRTTSMDHATTNADNMFDKLKLIYNNTRQAQVTKELMEIVSGADIHQSGS